jgi:hypothetical protein
MSESTQMLVEDYRQEVERYAFYDLNVWCDLSPQTGFYQPESLAQIVHDLEQCGIRRAVITHAQCLAYDPLRGNESMARLIDSQPCLFGAMVLVPDIALGGCRVQSYIDAKIQQRFVVARMFPKRLSHSMRKWQVGEMLAYLEQRRLPLMLWHNEVSWDLIESICQEYPELPVIVEGNDVKLLYHNRNYLVLLAHCPKLYLETHNLVLYSEIEYLAGQVAPDRLLYGSYFPYNTPHASLLPILRARLPDEVKGQLAARNLERLQSRIR